MCWDIFKENDNDSYHLVVVVSAMGRKGDPYATDTLLSLIRSHGDALSPRERDMLLGCGEMIAATVLCSILRSHSIPAIALTGGGAGIITDGQFGRARILEIRTEVIQRPCKKVKLSL